MPTALHGWEQLPRRAHGRRFQRAQELVLAFLEDLSAEQRADVLTGTARRFNRIRPSKGDSGE